MTFLQALNKYRDTHWKIFLFFFLLLSTNAISQNLKHIPDLNLRKELTRQGFTNKDSLLDLAKIEGRLQLELRMKNIENLDGLQYFQQV